MAHMVGSDPEQLDVLARQMTGSADRLEAIRSEVSALLGSTGWEGVDADTFRHQWHFRLSGQLRSVAAHTRQRATTLHVNAEQQRQASSSGGGTSGGVVGGSRGTGTSVLDFLEGVYQGEASSAALALLGKLGKVQKLINFAEKKSWLKNAPDWFRRIAVDDAAKSFPYLKNVVGAAKFASGKALPWFGAVVDTGHFLEQGAHGHWDFHSGFDAAMDVAAIASVEVPPLALGITAVRFVGDWAMDHPEATKQIISTSAAVAKDVAGGVVHAASDAEHAVTSAVSGGVTAVSRFFHL